MLPPEINSGLMYSGPGSGPMLAASASWEGLATELNTTAASYGSVISGLTSGPWLGPASASLAAAAAPHVAWLSSAAGQSEQAATQAAAAAAAYEGAFAATVPPPVIEANRALLMALLATNIFGQNTPAIAATEAEYAEMWAQDAAAMYSYAGASAAASTLTPFTGPAPATSPGGLASQAVAVSQAVGTSAATNLQGLSQLTSAMPDMLSQLGLGAYPGEITDVLGLTGHAWNSNGDGVIVSGLLGDVVASVTGSDTLDAGSTIDGFSKMISPTRLFVTTFQTVQGIEHNFESLAKPAADAAKAAVGAAKGAAEALPAAIPAAGLGAGLGAAGKAASIGALSVPQTWAAAAPAVSPATASLVSSVGAAAAAEPGTHTMGGLPMMGGAGRGLSAFAAPRYGIKLTVMPQLPVGG